MIKSFQHNSYNRGPICFTGKNKKEQKIIPAISVFVIVDSYSLRSKSPFFFSIWLNYPFHLLVF